MAIQTKIGQSAAGAAVLLAVIAGMLIMFIVMIPPQERAELLGDKTSSSTSSGTTASTSTNNLLTASPGKVDYLATKEIEHPLPVINVFTAVESKILAEKNLAYAKKGVFSGEDSTFKFSVDDLSNLQKAYLYFKVKAIKGKLMVSLNGEKIFDGLLEPGASIPLTLPHSSIKPENDIIFSASSPGLKFWATNEASLENLQVVADITNLESQSSSNVFLVSEVEKKNMEKATLKFKPECLPNQVGKLKVLINGNEVYNSVPDCEISVVPLEVSPALIKEGDNSLIFQADKGKYSLSFVTFESKLKELDYPTFYFDLTLEQYEEVKDNDADIKLRLGFVDATESKYGEYFVNGDINYFDTKDSTYEKDISDLVVKGKNSVKLKPKKSLEIRELKVDLVK
ncbi:hypothetical protein HZC30_04680 [Candidatus Woesearchaeota archaeon]|nr:hypothetical protein [Candidatus Woesearchaeota archaeon]